MGFSKILEVANHLSTNGENKTVGEHGGLWKLIEDEREEKDLQFPVLSHYV